jgi:hypothetical protein
MNDGQSTRDPQPDPAPFKVHLLTRAGRVVRARSEPVRAFSTKDEAVRFAGRQLGGHYAVYHKAQENLAGVITRLGSPYRAVSLPSTSVLPTKG